MNLPTPGYNYFTDNGRCLCFEHLGQSARYTGRDISGQPIERFDLAAFKDFRRAYPATSSIGKCEHCGTRPSR